MPETYRDLGIAALGPGSAAGRGRSVIAVIGIDAYAAWPKLSNAVADASGVSRTFAELGFEQAVPPLLDSQATGQAIRRLVTDDLASLTVDDSLVLFFAGHGHTQIARLGDTVVKTGYLMPVDAAEPGGQVASWVRLDSWLSDVSRLPPRHILVILDACHSGIALGALVRWRSAVPPAGPLDELQRRLSRRIITSALDDQRAMDGGPYPQHSLFTGCLLEGIKGGLASRGQRIATGSEIGFYVQQRVSSYPSSTQTPDFGALELDDRGEIVVPIGPWTTPDRSGWESAPSVAIAPSRRAPSRSRSQLATGWRRLVLAGAALAVAVSLIALVGLRSQHDGTTSDAGVIDAPALAVDAAPVPADAHPAALLADGLRWWTGRERGRDKARAYAIFADGCRGGHASACESALHALFHGGAVPEPQLRGLALACGASEPACVAGAVLDSDLQLAIRSCAVGVPTGCLVAAVRSPRLERDGYLRQAVGLLGEDMADAVFLRSFALAFGLGTPRDPHASTQLGTQGCSAGDLPSCELLRCLDPRSIADERMKALVVCQRAGVLPDYLMVLAQDALVVELLGRR